MYIYIIYIYFIYSNSFNLIDIIPDLLGLGEEMTLKTWSYSPKIKQLVSNKCDLYTGAV